MGGAEDPLAALLAAKIVEDPGYLQRILAQAAAHAQPPSKKPTNGLNWPRVLSLSNKEEAHGDSTSGDRSIERTLSNASTAIIEDNPEDDSNESPTRSRKEESSRSTRRAIPPSPTHSRSKSPSAARLHDRNRSRNRSCDRGCGCGCGRNHGRNYSRSHSRSHSRSRYDRSRNCNRNCSRNRRYSCSYSRSRSCKRGRKHRPRSCSPSPDHRKCRRKTRSPSPQCSPSPTDPNALPKPPEGWMDNDYYDRMPTSYYVGGQKGQGGRIVHEVNGRKTKEIQLSFLKNLKTRKKKYTFIDWYRHPFARKLGIPHFNPYGYVPRDPKVVPRISRPTGSDWNLLIEIGAVGDYEWLLDLLRVTQLLVNELKPNKSVLGPDKTSVTWKHFSSDTRATLYDKSYQAFPVLYHFRDDTGKDCWVIAEIARNYLSGGKAYKPAQKHIVDPAKRMRRNATKLVKNRKKEYTVPTREEDPYYIKAPTAGFTLATTGRKPITKDQAAVPKNYKSGRQACKADRVVAKEQARDKAASEAASKATSEAGPSRARPAQGARANETSDASSEAAPSRARPTQAAKVNTETEKTLNARARTGKGVEPTAPKGKSGAPQSTKNVRRIMSESKSKSDEEELLREVREMINEPTAKPTSTATSPVKPTRMEVEVILKSPAPTKSKGKEPVVAKTLKSKPRRAPTADHDSDSEVTKEPQRKRKATETQSTAARAQPSHKQVADEEQEQEQERPKRIRPKMRPPPAPEPATNPTPKPVPKSTPKPAANPAPEPAEPEDKQVAADERPKKKARLERESTFKSAPKSPAASAPKSSLEETASQPTAINGNRVVRTTKMMISVPNTRNLRPRK